MIVAMIVDSKMMELFLADLLRVSGPVSSRLAAASMDREVSNDVIYKVTQEGMELGSLFVYRLPIYFNDVILR